VLVLADAGVEVLRLDAIAFLWMRLGTSSQNQPEVHALTQALRALVRIVCPALVFKAEAIVAPSDLVQYLGQGEHHGKVSDLAYHNSLMVLIWSMLAERDVRLAVDALRRLPTTPRAPGSGAPPTARSALTTTPAGTRRRPRAASSSGTTRPRVTAG